MYKRNLDSLFENRFRSEMTAVLKMENITSGLDTGPVDSGTWQTKYYGAEEVLQVTYGIISLVGIFLNGVAVVTLAKERTLRKEPSSILRISICLSDLFTNLQVIPFKVVPPQITAVMPRNPAVSNFLCKVFMTQYPFFVTFFVSFTTLVCMAIERYVAVLFPTRFHLLTRKVVTVMAVAAWIIPVCTQAFLIPSFEYSEITGRCTYNLLYAAGIGFPTYILSAAMFYTLMSALPMVLFIPVIRKLRKQRRIVGPSNETVARKRRNVLTLTLMLSAVMLFITVFPYLLYNQLHFGLGRLVSIETPLYEFSLALATVNASTNPICYVIIDTNFRVGVGKLFGCQKILCYGSTVVSSVTGTPGVAAAESRSNKLQSGPVTASQI